jgi:tight adherence protein B
VSAQGWWVVAFLAGGAVVVLWPVGLARRRWTRRDPATLSFAWRPFVASVRAEAVRRPRRAVAVVAVLVGLGGWATAGPVAAGALGTYAALAARGVLRRWSNRERAASRARALDEVGALAADLRAGLPAAASFEPSASTDTSADSVATGSVRPAGSIPSARSAAAPDELRLRELTAAAWRLAERTGAPVADLVDRIEGDARAADRARASTAAQAAGARATAFLLAGLPAGGIALGYAIGADPLHVLLHTPLGAACVAGALLLQLGGLAWADRLAGSGTPR